MVGTLRFDDSLDTVMASDMTTPFGAQSAWRQLTDLIARRRIDMSAGTAERLRGIRETVPASVRAASARAAAAAHPPAALVRLFADDEPAVAAPILGAVRLDTAEWVDMLPDLPLTARALLRNRRDLPPGVVRALQAFGPADFALPTPDAEAIAQALAAEAAVVADAPAEPVADTPATPAGAEATGPFPIAELVARIDAYRRGNGDLNPPPRQEAAIHAFRFETDEAAAIRWVEGAPREPLIGLSLGYATARVDGVASGAFRRRAAFDNARLLVEGASPVAGQWLLSAVPAFDPASGRFTGYRGIARRPRADEGAERAGEREIPPDSLRQLVHELRTPTNAISGFAEMIEGEYLGPAPEVYRARASEIRGNVRDLLDTIDDVDTAARIAQKALVLHPGIVGVADLLTRVMADLAPLIRLHQSVPDVDAGPDGLAVAGDPVAIERVVARLAATAIGATGAGESVGIRARADADAVFITFDRPRAFAALSEDALLRLEQSDAQGSGPSLLGTGFALRLARNLAAELGGGLSIDDDRLTLRLPAALDRAVEQQSSQ